ncbi:MAG: AAA family ATPase [Myxococcota bacterium]|nr:AAA family ATPase [Myxococcota bacterium]
MRVIAVVNQKGGCGKTTTTVNLAGCLAHEGHRVVVVDLDPQSHATLALGIDPDAVDENLYDVLAEPGGEARLEEILAAGPENVDVAPSGIVLSALEQRLASEPVETRAERLRAALEPLADRYDYALIDCPPSVGLLTFNALRAASEVIVPLETSPFAIHGVEKLLETIGLLVERIGHDLEVRVLPTLYDGRTRYGRETLARIRERFKDMCLDTVIRSNVKLREAAARGLPIVNFARTANGAIDYGALAVEIEALGLSTEDLLASFEEAPREVIVRYRDETAHDVRIAGDFNGWVPDKGVRSLIESEGTARVWTKILQLPPGTYEYRYVVDGEWRTPAEEGSSRTSDEGGAPPNSVLVVR